MNQNRKAPVAQLDAVKIFETLHRMKGKSYIFKGKNIVVESVSEVSEGFYVTTSVKIYTFTLEHANGFIAECYPVESLMQQANTAIAVRPVSKEATMLEDMTEDMYNIFKALKKTPTKEVIEQATAMSNASNTITNMLKLKLSAVKLANRIN